MNYLGPTEFLRTLIGTNRAFVSGIFALISVHDISKKPIDSWTKRIVSACMNMAAALTFLCIFVSIFPVLLMSHQFMQTQRTKWSIFWTGEEGGRGRVADIKVILCENHIQERMRGVTLATCQFSDVLEDYEFLEWRGHWLRMTQMEQLLASMANSLGWC